MLSKEPLIVSFKQINSNCLNVPIKKRIGVKQESIEGGSDCSTVVERKPSYRESVGSNPAFSLLYHLSSVSLIQVPQRGETLLVFLQEYT